MKLKTAYEDALDTSPAVPDALYRSLLRSLRGVKAIAVDTETTPGRHKVANVVLLDERKGDKPSEDPHEIAELVTEVMHRAWTDAGAQDSVRFRVRCERDAQNGRSRGEQTRFTISYSGEEAEEDDALSEAHSLQHEVLMETIEGQRRTIETVSFHLDEAHGRILELASTMREPITTAASMLNLAGGMFTNAMQAQLNQAQQNFDLERIKIEERERSKRWDKLGRRVLPFALKAADQALKKYTGGGIPGLDEALEEEMGDEDEEDVRPPRQAPPPKAPSAAAEPEPAAEEHPLFVWADALAHSLTPDQHENIADAVPKAARKRLYAFLRSTDPAEIAERFGELVNKHGAQLLALQQVLSPEQRKLIAAIHRAVESAGDEEAGD